MKIRIGTRGSDLALKQTRMVIGALLAQYPHLECEIIEIKTSGDKKQGTERAQFGDKKDWVYELELALLSDTIDIAVHSAKDVPGNTEPGLALLPVLTRATPNDIFIGKKDASGIRLKFADLPAGAFVGTSSLRRKAALLLHRRDLKIIDHRGNVPTRLRKLEESTELSGIILAAAGVERLGILSSDDYEKIHTETMVPSANQGILVVQLREGDTEHRTMLESLSHEALRAAFTAERNCAHTLGGDCNSAIGVFGEIQNGDLKLYGTVYHPQGQRAIQESILGSITDAERLGKSLAAKLLNQGAAVLLG